MAKMTFVQTMRRKWTKLNDAPLKRKLIEERDRAEESEPSLGVHKKMVVRLDSSDIRSVFRSSQGTMDALSFVLPLTAFAYLLPPNTSDGKMVNAAEQSMDFVVDINTLKEFYEAIEKVKPEQKYLLRGSVLQPLEVLRPVVIDPANDAMKLNIDLRTKLESKNAPLVPDIVSTNVRVNNEATSSHNAPLEDLYKSLTKEKRAKSTAKILAKSPAKIIMTARDKKDAIVFRPYIDIKDTLKKKQASIQLETNLETAKGNTRRTNVLVLDNFAERQADYIRLCEKLIGPTSSLVHKLLGADCVRLLRSKFYLEQNTKEDSDEQDDAEEGHVGLKIRAKAGIGKDYKDLEYKQRDDAMIEASVSDSLRDYYGPVVKMADPNARIVIDA